MWDYRRMNVWIRADKLAKEVNSLTLSFPSFEKFELGSQMRRSSGSMPDNIVEGSGKTSDKEFVHFLNYAKGSARELDSQVGRCVEAGYFSEEVGKRLKEEILVVVKMICGTIRKLKRDG
jgi:four helix bundle protein